MLLEKLWKIYLKVYFKMLRMFESEAAMNNQWFRFIGATTDLHSF
jgi:hypothetical protein